MYKIVYTNRMKCDAKLMKKRGKDMSKLVHILSLLAGSGDLPLHRKDHQLRKNRTIDWQKKESTRAGLRRMVKQMLKKHRYPPEGMEDAIQTVMSQCELWVDEAETD